MLIDTIGVKYGDIASILKTHVPYVFPPIGPDDYIPADLPADIDLTPASIRDNYLRAVNRRLDRVEDMRKQSKPFFRDIYATISEDSRNIIKALPGYADGVSWGVLEAPNELWAGIRLTHHTNENAGDGIELAALNLMDKEESFMYFRQGPTIDIHTFKKEFVLKVASLEAAGSVIVGDEARKAMHFLTKLDKLRHGEMMLQLTNRATEGTPFPATVELAYTFAKNWKTKKSAGSTATAGDGAGTFMLSDDVRHHTSSTPQAPPSRAKASSKAAAAATDVSAVSGSSGQTGKYAYESIEEQAARLAFWAVRACRNCGMKGHIAPECPSKKKKPVLLAVGGDDEEDDNGPTFMVSDDPPPHPCNDDDVLPVLFFSPTEVLIDNAAGQCVFNNPDLVHSLCVADGSHGVNGVNKAAAALAVEAEGKFADVACKIHIAKDSAANLLSQAMLIDAGCKIHYNKDMYTVRTPSRVWLFKRKLHQDGRKSKYYVRDMADEIKSAAARNNHVLVATVEENLRRVTKREAAKAAEAVILRTRLGHASTKAMIDILQGGVNNCPVTPADVKLSEEIFGKSIAALKGKTKKHKSIIASAVLTGVRRETQVQQTLNADLLFNKGLIFLIGVFTPLGLTMGEHLKDKSATFVGPALKKMIASAHSHLFTVSEIKVDGEKSIAAMIPELNDMGIQVNPAGPGQHVPVVERMIQTVKSVVRSFEHALPYVMPRLVLIFCVLYAIRCTNYRPNSSSMDKTSPLEQFTGLKPDFKRDLRCGFGDLVQATVPVTDNSMQARTQGCICLLPTGNTTGSVKMWALGTDAVVTRDAFTVVPATPEVCKYITLIAERQGFSRGSDPSTEGSVLDHVSLSDESDEEDIGGHPLPDMMPIDGRVFNPPPATATVVHDALDVAIPQQSAVDAGVIVVGAGDTLAAEHHSSSVPSRRRLPTLPPEPRQSQRLALRRIVSSSTTANSLQPLDTQSVTLLNLDMNELRADLCRQILRTSDWHDDNFAFKITVKSAMRDRPAEALPVILSELEQMLTKGVWHGVHAKHLSSSERRAVIRSSMFLKDKYLATGVFDKFKARLVAGGDQQDKGLYEDLSSPTAATASVFAIAAIAASEGRYVIVTDIGGAFLNASLKPTGIKVHMRLDPTMARLLVQIAPEYGQYLDDSGCMIVELDKALYGCVEASLLWYNDLCSKLVAFGFVANPYDQCVFNKLDSATGKQITVVLHVDDLMITSASQPLLDEFHVYLNSVYPETKSVQGPVVNYLGMCFDFSNDGEVRITMEHCVNDILKSCGEVKVKPTPASSTLFDINATQVKVSEEQRKFFHTHVAKLLYLAKRVRPECLTAVAFLSTRVQACDIDDLAKLVRLLGYVKGTSSRGIVLRVGESMTVKAYIDAAYGVHTASGKSHTGCAIVLGDVGALFAKSSKQKIVTKSSTEAELVGLSDTASQAIHLRNFVLAQGYETGPAIIYQDNLSCMALMKRGSPGSERSRHINIRHFWIKEKVDSGEVVIQHLGTKHMIANALTKPVQGEQFAVERLGLTGWM